MTSRAKLRAVGAASKEGGDFPKPPSPLLMELMLVRASSGDIVAEMHIGDLWATVQRGPAAVHRACTAGEGLDACGRVVFVVDAQTPTTCLRQVVVRQQARGKGRWGRRGRAAVIVLNAGGRLHG